MTESKTFFDESQPVTVGQGSVAADQQAQESSPPSQEKKKLDADYYNVKIPTLGTAWKQLWNGGKKIVEKAEPLADVMLDKMVGGIAKVAGLPDPKTGKSRETKSPTTEPKPPQNT